MLRRFSVFSLSLLLCLSLFPSRAFASYFSGSASVLWSGSVNGGAQYGAFVKGGTNYDAAVAALGYDSSRLSDEVKTRLADESYSGYFYTFATSFQRVSTPFDIPSWVPVFVTTGSVIADLWNNISGSSYPHWSVEVVSVLYDLALRDFKAVLDGEDLGGGGDSGGGADVSSSFPSSITLDTFYGVYVAGSSWTSAKYEVYGSQTVYFSNPSALSSWVSARGLNYFYFLNAPQQGRNNSISASPNVAMYASASPIEFSFSTASGDIPRVTVVATSSSNIWFSGSYSNGSYSTDFYGGRSERLGTFTYSYDYLPLSEKGTAVSYSPTWGSGSRTKYITHVAYNGAPVVAPPSGVWPEPDVPVAPVAPELPEPADPVVETPVSPTVPAPVWPDITINIDNDPTPGTTPSGLDYTELLTRINDNLISIDSFVRAINSNLNSLRGDLLAEFNGVFDSLRNIYNYLLTIDSVLETHCTHLRNKMEESAVFIANYMRTLIKWLADQLDYDDLTNVEAPDNSLLTTINEKLGGGTYEPNPIKDEQGYYEWLDDLWDRFLLGDNWQTSMGNISGSFSELKTRFPFSVPWDIVALFRLFVHDPVTPVFDLPLYFSADGSTSVHVDLSPWDSVASLVRPMVFVIFALKLALLSRDLLGGLGADKGGL